MLCCVFFLRQAKISLGKGRVPPGALTKANIDTHPPVRITGQRAPEKSVAGKSAPQLPSCMANAVLLRLGQFCSSQWDVAAYACRERKFKGTGLQKKTNRKTAG